MILQALEQIEEGRRIPNEPDLVDAPPPDERLSTLRWASFREIVTGDAPDLSPTIIRRSDGSCLAYRNASNTIYSEPGLGKSLLAQIIEIEHLRAGGAVIVVDFEDIAEMYRERANDLGVDDQELTRWEDDGRLSFCNPDPALGLFEVAELVERVEALPDAPMIVRIDAWTGALTANGLEENTPSDITAWVDRIVKPLTSRDVCVVILDHVTKDPATRVRGGRGSGAKLSNITGAAYELVSVRSFARGSEGLLRLRVGKDRRGYIGKVGEVVAEITLTPSERGIAWSIDPPADPDAPFRPTVLMERVSIFVERSNEAGEAPSGRTIEEGVQGKGDAIRTAIRILVDEGFLERVKAGRGFEHRSVKPYRQDLDASPSSSRPDRVPDALGATASPRPPRTSSTGDGDALPGLDTTNRVPNPDQES